MSLRKTPDRLTFGRCAALVLTALPWFGSLARAEEGPAAADLEFFEKKIRPLFVQNCFACHSAGQKVRGGLRLDTVAGRIAGGDSGPVIVPGQPDQSLLITAVRNTDTGLVMPPKGKLPAASIEALEEWIRRGAISPPDESAAIEHDPIDWAAAREFWAYRPLVRPGVPPVANPGWSDQAIDRFIQARREVVGLTPAEDAPREALIRRVTFDLTGLPPTVEEIDAFLSDTRPEAYAAVVDRLLASSAFAEHWARHWLDLARYGESLTLRGFVFPEAWRYRDYVIASFREDRPYDQFLREQVAGDLLPAANLDEQQRQLVATTFLALGNTNLEEQEKRQLDMDVVDEQLDVIGKAFLGQTIGCARCHDHKFDPIPTHDYYALAGIFRNTQLLAHDNVSKWKEVSLPLAPDDEALYAGQDAAISAMEKEIRSLRADLNRMFQSEITPIKELAGIVVDDREAKRVGEWKESQHTRPYIGEGYLHDLATGQGEKTLTFSPLLPAAGRYEVRLAYTPGDNRATNASVTVFSAAGLESRSVNLREPPPVDRHFVSLGEFRFETSNQTDVIVSNEGADGHVVVDAVQFLPLEGAPTAASITPADRTAEAETLKKRIEERNAALADLRNSGPRRPKVMTVIERREITDSPVHIRGSVQRMGEIVPRGFLQIVPVTAPAELPPGQSGRREFAVWLTSAENPLPARVYVNRVWHWLFGKGLSPSVDNFGATGEPPSHPELLDHLAAQFRDGGWSTKRLVRSIVLSRTYRQSSAEPADIGERDPENRLWSRMPRRRLEAESIRDAMLAVSGELHPGFEGRSFPVELTADYDFVDLAPRRSIYVPAFRNSRPSILEVFESADPSNVVGARNSSTVVTQALFLLNDPWVKARAEAAAARLLSVGLLDDEQRLELACRWTLGRRPSDQERNVLRPQPAPEASVEAARLQHWASVFQILFASLDFRYLD